MLSRQAAHDRMQEQFGGMTIPTETGDGKSDSKLEQVNVKKVLDVTIRHPEAIPEKMAAKRKAPSTNFLIAGAKQAKAARSARNAARVGCFASSSTKLKKLSNTGSGVPLTQVVRLKYVKGFTQAVSTPCRLEDLAL
jgi:hypothetical protein